MKSSGKRTGEQGAVTTAEKPAAPAGETAISAAQRKRILAAAAQLEAQQKMQDAGGQRIGSGEGGDGELTPAAIEAQIAARVAAKKAKKAAADLKKYDKNGNGKLARTRKPPSRPTSRRPRPRSATSRSTWTIS